MSRIKLKSVIDIGGKAAAFLDVLCQHTGGCLAVFDHRRKLLYGQEPSGPAHFDPIDFEGETLGYLTGGAGVPLAKHAIASWLAKEKETKIVRGEILDLYREINLIYKFAEQLSDHIDPKSIAELALREANKIMRTAGGSVVLQEGSETSMALVAQVGDSWAQITAGNGLAACLPLIQKKNPQLYSIEVLRQEIAAYPEAWGPLIFAPLKVKSRTLGMIYLIGRQEQVFKAADLKLLTTLALQTASAIESALLYERQIQEAREREDTMKQVQEMTSRFVPFEFLRSLGHNSLMETQLGDHVENVVTVVFIDIRKYTTLSEHMTPEDNFGFVNSFNRRIGPVIKENGGFINQYLGDGVMAIFPNSPTEALTASVQMLGVIESYNQHRVSKGRKRIRIGIGIHTGPLIMGITGDHRRWDATTISDTVNSASRIERLTRFYKCNIILSQQTHDLLDDAGSFHVRPLGRVQLKGRQEAMRIYECFDGDQSWMIESKIASLDRFNLGIQSYENKNFRESTRAFSQVLAGNPDDGTAQYFLGKISNLITSELSVAWNGIDKSPDT